jgi:predicted ATPase
VGSLGARVSGPCAAARKEGGRRSAHVRALIHLGYQPDLRIVCAQLAGRSGLDAQGFPLLLGEGKALHGAALAGSGAGVPALAKVSDALASLGDIGTNNTFHWPHGLAMLATIQHAAGQHVEGLATLENALAFSEDTGAHSWDAELHRLKGELLLAMQPGSAAEAEALFRRALEIARAQEAKSFELRAATSLARLWQRQGKLAEARALLAPVYAWFTEGFDTRDLVEAKALLEELR